MTSTRAAIAALVTAAVLIASAAPAWPCGNPTELSRSEGARQLRRAEAALAAGDAETAFALVNPRNFEFPDWLHRQHTLILAVACLRANRLPGSWNAPRIEDTPPTPVQEAITRLGWLSSWDNPEVNARLAEAYAASPDPAHAGKAAALIEDLASRDLMPDAEAYRTLALVRSRAGDAAGADAALARCRKIARKAQRDRICQLPAS